MSDEWLAHARRHVQQREEAVALEEFGAQFKSIFQAYGPVGGHSCNKPDDNWMLRYPNDELAVCLFCGWRKEE